MNTLTVEDFRMLSHVVNEFSKTLKDPSLVFQYENLCKKLININHELQGLRRTGQNSPCFARIEVELYNFETTTESSE